MNKRPRNARRRPDHQSEANRPAGQYYPGWSAANTYHQHSYDWRSAQQQSRPPCDPYQQVHQPRPERAALNPHARKRSRAGVAVLGAAAVAMASGGVAAVVVATHSDQPAALRAAVPAASSPAVPTAAPGQPAASVPAGSVEQVAAKVVPSVVKLQIDMGNQSEEGSGVILSSDGLILTNNHVVAAVNDAAGGPAVQSAPSAFGDPDTPDLPG